jgi:hypothetical protein
MNKIALSIAVSIMGLALAVPDVVAQPVSLAAASKAEQRKQKAASVARAAAKAKAALKAKKEARRALAEAQAASRKSKAPAGSDERIALISTERLATEDHDAAVQKRKVLKQRLAFKRKEKLDAFIARIDSASLATWRNNVARSARSSREPSVAGSAGQIPSQPAGVNNTQVDQFRPTPVPNYGRLPQAPPPGGLAIGQGPGQQPAPDNSQVDQFRPTPIPNYGRLPRAYADQATNPGSNAPGLSPVQSEYVRLPDLDYASAPELLAAARRNALAQGLGVYDRVDQPLNLD